MSQQAAKLEHTIREKPNATSSVWQPITMAERAAGISLSVASGKGGVGKTNFALNFALALRQAQFRVLLVDADLGLANVDILLGRSPEYHLGDYLWGGLALEKIIRQGPENLEIISAKNGVVELANLPPGQIERLLTALEALESRYDYIIFDTAAGIHWQTTAFTFAAREIFLLVTPEPTSLMDAYSLIKIMIRQQPGKRINVVVNMARHAREGIATFNTLADLSKRFLKKSLFFSGTLSADNQVWASVRRQNPVLLFDPSTSFSRELIALRDAWLKGARIPSSIGMGARFKKFFKWKENAHGLP